MKDYAWAVAIGALSAASPLTGGSRLLPSLVAGTFIGGFVFGLRRDWFARWLPAWPREIETRPLALRPSLPAWLCVAAAVLVCAPAIVWLWQQYTYSIWRNGHGLFLPLIVFALARAALRREPVAFVPDPLFAAPFLAVAVFLCWLEAVTRLGYPGAIGVVSMTIGACLLVLGREATRRIAFPLALLLFLLPVPQGLVDPLGLSTGTTVLAEPLLHALGTRGMRDETLIAAPNFLFSVSANCSGLSTFYAGVLVALVIGRELPVAARVLLVVSVWPLTIAVNSLRVVFLVQGTLAWGLDWVHSPLHGLSGIATFVGVVACVGVLGLSLRRATLRWALA